MPAVRKGGGGGGDGGDGGGGDSSGSGISKSYNLLKPKMHTNHLFSYVCGNAVVIFISSTGHQPLYTYIWE